MDLQDFSGDKMYFDESLPDKVTELIDEAADLYGEGDAESPLLKAFFLAPESLSVLVALYRFHYYQHRYSDALHCADLAMARVAKELKFPTSWRALTMEQIGYGVMQSMTLVRFYLLALKGAGYLNLRLDRIDDGMEMLQKVVDLDSEDRLGARLLLDTVAGYKRRKDANFGLLTLVA